MNQRHLVVSHSCLRTFIACSFSSWALTPPTWTFLSSYFSSSSLKALVIVSIVLIHNRRMQKEPKRSMKSFLVGKLSKSNCTCILCVLLYTSRTRLFPEKLSQQSLTNTSLLSLGVTRCAGTGHSFGIYRDELLLLRLFGRWYWRHLRQ